MKLRFKYGLKMLFRNPVRIAASFLAAIIALGIAGMCIFMQTYNILLWGKQLFFEYSGLISGINDPYIGFVWNRQNTYPNFFTSPKFTKEGLEQAEAMIEDLGGYAILCYENRDPPIVSAVDLYKYVNGNETNFWGEHNGEILFAPYPNQADKIVLQQQTQKQKACVDISRQLYECMTVYSGEDAMEAFGYTLVGKLPEAEDEVAVPQWLYNCFLCYGYKSTDGTVYEINSEADIIGKTLQLYHGIASYPIVDNSNRIIEAEIVGVIHTDYEAEHFPERIFSVKENNRGERLSVENYDSYTARSGEYLPAPHMGLVISREYMMNYTQNNTAATLIEVPRYQPYSEQYFDRFYRTDESSSNEFYLSGTNYLRIASSPAVVTLDISVREIYEDVAIFFQIVPYFGLFAALLLIYLCFSTVMGKRRGIGIMQSMGASKWQTILTIGVPILLFCLLCSLGALCVELGFLSYMNGRLTNTIAELEYFYDYSVVELPYPFTLGWQTWLFTFGVPIAIAAVTTLVTVWLVFRTPVVDNLNKKDFRLFRKKVKTNPFTNLPWSGT